MTYIKYKNAS